MSLHPDDRPDPAEQPIRARVPDRVAGGCFSTGVIVMTAPTEFVLDFVQNLGRPHQIVARVVMPHSVLPQLVDALGRNMQLYRGRWGELPQPQLASSVQIAGWSKSNDPSNIGPPLSEGQAAGSASHPSAGSAAPSGPSPSLGASPGTGMPSEPDSNRPALTDSSEGAQQAPDPQGWSPEGGPPLNQTQSGHPLPGATSDSGTFPPVQHPGPGSPLGIGHPPAGHQPGGGHPSGAGQGVRQATAQEIYDDLKIRDELLSGVYANAVMIGHGPHEFSFDFITNFYPHSAVSARVFLAAGQIPRLHDSLRGTWEQLRLRMQPPPPENPPPGWVV